MELNEILKIALKGGASDIHLKPGLPAMFRVDGILVPLKNGERLSPEQVQQMAFGIMNPVQQQRFDETREVDLAYGIAGLGRFRVNVFQQRGTVGSVFRVIPFGVKSIEQLRTELAPLLPPPLDADAPPTAVVLRTELRGRRYGCRAHR